MIVRIKRKESEPEANKEQKLDNSFQNQQRMYIEPIQSENPFVKICKTTKSKLLLLFN